jgi:hypothetical protein
VREKKSCEGLDGRLLFLRSCLAELCILEDEGDLLLEVGFERRWNAFERNRDR